MNPEVRRGDRFFAPHFDRVEAPPALRVMIVDELGRPERRWHGVLHHALMFRNVARTGLGDQDRRRLTWAVLFHDIVYDATRSDNEEASVEVMRRWVSGKGAGAVAALILATKRHDLDTDPLTRRFLEADLGVLWTSSAQLYGFYADGIRAEYGHVADRDYRNGRAAVLTGLHDRVNPRLDDRRSAALGTNIDWELNGLREGRFDKG